MYEIHHIIIAFLLGLVTGVFSCLILNKNNFKTDKIVSLVVIAFWISLHSIAFFTELNVAWMFDVVGMGATGHMIGLDIIDLIKKR